MFLRNLDHSNFLYFLCFASPARSRCNMGTKKQAPRTAERHFERSWGISEILKSKFLYLILQSLYVYFCKQIFARVVLKKFTLLAHFIISKEMVYCLVEVSWYNCKMRLYHSKDYDTGLAERGSRPLLKASLLWWGLVLGASSLLQRCSKVCLQMHKCCILNFAGDAGYLQMCEM